MLDFGDVVRGRPYVREVGVQLIGREPVALTAGSDCVCLTPAPERLTAMPGRAFTWSLKLETCSLLGDVRSRAWLQDMSGRVVLDLPVRYRVVPSVFAEPPALHMGILGNEPADLLVRIHSADEERRVLAVGCGHPGVLVEAQDRTFAPGAPATLRVLVQAGAPGPFSAVVWVDTDDPERPRLRIPIVATHVPGAKCDPRAVNFGEVPFGSSQTHELLIDCPPGTTISGLRSSDDAVRVTQTRTAARAGSEDMQVRVTLSSSPELRLGIFSGRLTADCRGAYDGKIYFHYRGRVVPPTANDVSTDERGNGAPGAAFAGVCLLLPALLSADEAVRLDFPESVELRILIDYVARTLGLNVLYDANQVRQEVSMRVTNTVNRDELLPLLRAVLRSRNLALLPRMADWYEVVPTDQFAARVGASVEAIPDGNGDNEVLSLLIPLDFADPQQVSTALKPYLHKNAAISVSGRRLVLTDFVNNLRRAQAVAAQLDQPATAHEITAIAVRHRSPIELAATINDLLREPGAPKLPGVRSSAAVQPGPEGASLLVLGSVALAQRVQSLVERFDVPSDRLTRSYNPQYITAARLRTLIEQLLPQYDLLLAADEFSNTLIVEAPDAAHTRIVEIIAQFDRARINAATPQRIYRLLNRRADDMFATLGSLLLGEDANAGAAGTSAQNPLTFANGSAGGADSAPRDGNIGQATSGGVTSNANGDVAGAGGRAVTTALRGEGFSLALDEHTNSIIAIATPEVHRQIEDLIRQLDRRRPQVLIEVTLVSVSVEESVNLGVELQTLDLGDSWDFLLFTSYGLTNVNTTTGQRTLAVAPGGSGILLAPDEVPIVLQALQSRGTTRVYSAPRILVDDNATGRIESVAEAPFTSVNASDTVATTAFAGFAKAGTQLTIEPHIAEGDHLEIEYDLTVSSFTGSGGANTPPPRSSDAISSTIRVPDGHTVVVGGLLTETLAESTSQVPGIGDVPILGWLFGSRSDSRSKVRLYAFIRPSVLRDEAFADLRYLSQRDLEAADVDDGMPPTRLQTMR